MVAVAERTEQVATGFLDLEAFERTPLITEPFAFVVVPGFLRPAMLPVVSADFPRIDQPGSFPVDDLRFGPMFARLLQELAAPPFRHAVARKFGLDLDGRPTMVTVRGQARLADGKIHTDTSSKLITVLVYMNESWEAQGGRLRLLRRPDDLDDAIAEVPPAAGTLLIFRVLPNSWHGHEPFNGPRRVIQLNWVESDAVVRRERFRHGVSARLKRLFSGG
jgi:hypothetical protein